MVTLAQNLISSHPQDTAPLMTHHSHRLGLIRINQFDIEQVYMSNLA